MSSLVPMAELRSFLCFGEPEAEAPTKTISSTFQDSLILALCGKEASEKQSIRLKCGQSPTWVIRQTLRLVRCISACRQMQDPAGETEAHCDIYHAVDSFQGLQGEFQKTGVFLNSAGDFREFSVQKFERRSLETVGEEKSPGGPSCYLRKKSRKRGQPGWRRSADRARLRPNCLLTGNFTGNFAILRLRDMI